MAQASRSGISSRLQMGSTAHPLPDTGPYFPPPQVETYGRSDRGGPRVNRALSGDFRGAGYGTLLGDLFRTLAVLYPVSGGSTPEWIGDLIGNSRPVADRQRLTMSSEEHPLPDTGPYHPPSFVRPGRSGQPLDPMDFVRALLHPGGNSDLAHVMMHLYPMSPWAENPMANSQAIGDRNPTTMVDPLPNYRPPTMINNPIAQQIRTLINQHLQGQSGPLVNVPLQGAPTMMGRR